MKRAHILLALCIIFAMGAAPVQAKEDVIEIKERVFVSLINDIYLNAEDYVGKKIRLQGVFEKIRDEDTKAYFYSITRQGPGCCGSDLNPGFEVIWDKKYPRHGSWVDATGVLEIYDKGYVRLRLTELKAMPKAGRLIVK